MCLVVQSAKQSSFALKEVGKGRLGSKRKRDGQQADHRTAARAGSHIPSTIAATSPSPEERPSKSVILPPTNSLRTSKQKQPPLPPPSPPPPPPPPPITPTHDRLLLPHTPKQSFGRLDHNAEPLHSVAKSPTNCTTTHLYCNRIRYGAGFGYHVVRTRKPRGYIPCSCYMYSITTTAATTAVLLHSASWGAPGVSFVP